MSLNKIILSIALGMLFHGAIICMENQDNLEKESVISMAGCISDFVRESAHNPKHIELLGYWLTMQRNAISEADKWNNLIKNLTGNVMYCRCHCLENKTTYAVSNVVEEVAQGLQPGQDCSQLLVYRAQEAVTVTACEWKDAQAKKNPYDFF